MSIGLFLLLSVSASSPSMPSNVVLLSVDTLRADYLGCYGCPYETSPNLDRLAEQSLVFEDCVCEVPLTGPACGSMLTSLYPRMTGTVRNGLRMAPSAPLVQEQLHASGYQTYCVQSNWTLKADLSGLDRGFDTYDDDFHKKRWGIIKPERYADEVTDICLKLLSNRDPNRPFFLWAHYSDPHAPYRHHKDYDPMRRGTALSKRTERTRAKYASEIAFTDHHIARLLDALPKKNTAIMFVADHGESLYEHGYLGHGRRVHQTCVHIPLMIYASTVQAGRTKASARGVDVAPTLLSLAGLSPLPGMLGRNLLDEEGGITTSRVIEAYGCAVPRGLGVENLMSRIAPQQQGVLQDGWKAIVAGSHVELYRLADDPGEEHNLAESMPERVAGLREIIRNWTSKYPRGQALESALSHDDRSALESLGYLK